MSTFGDLITQSSGNPEVAKSGGSAPSAASTSGPEVTSAPKSTRRLHGQRGPDKRVRRRRQKSVTEVDAQSAAAMHAMGLPKTKIAKVLDLPLGRVSEVLDRPGIAEMRDRMREAIRVQTLGAVQQVQEQTWGWLAEVVARKDPRAFDAITRGLAALERTASSASGENRKIEATLNHAVDGVTTEEVRELVKALLADSPADAVAEHTVGFSTKSSQEDVGGYRKPRQ